MNILKDFTKFEKIWVTIFTLLIMGTTIYFSSTMTDYTSMENIILNWLISPASAIAGIFCVVLCAKGKISTFTWGVINTLTYGYIAFKGGVYGDMIINLLYFLPLQFVGFKVWKTKMSGDTVKSSFLKHPIITAIGALVFWLGFSILLDKVDGFFTGAMKKSSAFYTLMPGKLGVFLDSFTEVGQFFGQYLLTIAKVEQWIFWFLINLVSIFMWVCIIIGDPTSLPYAVPTLVMWCAYTCNCIYAWGLWTKGAKETK